MAKHRPVYVFGPERLGKVSCVGLLALVALAIVSSTARAVPVSVDYQATDLGGGQWKYHYRVSNDSLPEAMREFTIYFDHRLYRNLKVVSLGLQAGTWDELVLQPDPFLSDAGMYDALSLSSGILPGESKYGFGVQFDWLGTGSPGPQSFEVINPQTFQSIYSGTTTVPEPGTAALLVLAVRLALIPRRRPA